MARPLSRYRQRWLNIRRMVITTLAALPEPWTREDAWFAVRQQRENEWAPPSSTYVMSIIDELERDGDVVRVHYTDGRVRPYLYRWAEGDST